MTAKALDVRSQGSKKKDLKMSHEFSGIPTCSLQIDHFTQALFGKAESIIIDCAILILVVRIPLYWLKLKAEGALIRGIRSARSMRQTQNSAPITNASETLPHCPVCNALMVKRFARRGPRTGSNFWGCSNYPKCRGTARFRVLV